MKELPNLGDLHQQWYDAINASPNPIIETWALRRQRIINATARLDHEQGLTRSKMDFIEAEWSNDDQREYLRVSAKLARDEPASYARTACDQAPHQASRLAPTPQAGGRPKAVERDAATLMRAAAEIGIDLANLQPWKNGLGSPDRQAMLNHVVKENDLMSESRFKKAWEFVRRETE